MGYFAVTILVVGALFVASRLVRLLHLWSVLRTATPEQQHAEIAIRAKELGDSDDADDAETVGVAIALALREAEAEQHGRELDGPP